MADYDLQYQDNYIDVLLATANELKTAGYIFKGVATPSTNPGTPSERVAYLASEPGTYTNFGGIVITSGLYSLTYASGTWTATQMSAGSDIEVVQTTGQSTSAVMSQKAVTDEIDIISENIEIIDSMYDSNIFDIAASTLVPKANYVNVTKDVSDDKITLTCIGTQSNRVNAMFSLPPLIVGKEYKLSFDFVNNISGDGVTVLCLKATNQNTSLTYLDVTQLEARDGSYSTTITAVADIGYLSFHFIPVNGDSFVVSNFKIKEYKGSLSEYVRNTYLPVISQKVYGDKTNIDIEALASKKGYPGQIIWVVSSDIYLKTHISFPVNEGEVYEILCGDNGSAFFYLTTDDNVTTNGQPASVVDGTQAVVGAAGELLTAIIPHGCNYIAIGKSLSSVNDKLPQYVCKVTKEIGAVIEGNEKDLLVVDGNGNAVAEFSNGHIKTKFFNSSDTTSVGGMRIDYINSLQQTTKVLTIEEQEMIPSSGVCITSYGGHLYCSINGVKYEINLTPVE